MRDRIRYAKPLTANMFFQVVLLLGIVLFLVAGGAVVIYRYPVDYGEGPLLDQVRRLTVGENIYSKTPEHWTVTNYPPLYHLLIAPMVRASGPSYAYGRALSVVATLASGLLVYRLAKALSGDVSAALVSSCLFLNLPFVFGWGLLHRVDMVAMAFGLSALLVLYRKPSRHGVSVAALLSVAAVATKQSFGFAGPGAACVWLWYRDRRLAYCYGLWYAMYGLVALSLLWLLAGNGITYHLVLANANPIRPATILEGLAFVMRDLGLFVVAGTLALGRVVRARGDLRLPVAYTALCLMMVPTIGKVGSNLNYLIEWGAAMSLVIGLGYALYRAEGSKLGRIMGALLAVQSMWLIAGEVALVRKVMQNLRSPIEGRALEALLAATPGPVLADFWVGLMPLLGRPIEVQPLEMNLLALDGRVDLEPLVERLQSAYYARLFIQCKPNPDTWSDVILRAIDESYALELQLGSTCVYEPSRRATVASNPSVRVWVAPHRFLRLQGD